MGKPIKRLLSLEHVMDMIGQPVYIVDDYSGTQQWEIVKAIEDGTETDPGKLVCESGLTYPLKKYQRKEGWSAYEQLVGMSAIKTHPAVRKAGDFKRYCRDHKGQEVLVVKAGNHITVKQDSIKGFIEAQDSCSASYVVMWSGDKYPTYSYGDAWCCYEYDRPIPEATPPKLQPAPKTGDTKFCSKCGKAHSVYSETFNTWHCLDCGNNEPGVQ